MRFLFLTLGYHPDLVGGAYRYVTEVAERLAALGHRVDVICPNPDGTRLAAEELRAGVSLHRYPNGTGTPWANWWRENTQAEAILRRITNESAEAVLTVACHAYFTAPRPSRSMQVVSLFTGPWAEEFQFARQSLRRSWPQRTRDQMLAGLMRLKERTTLRNVARILTISQYYAAQLPRWHGHSLPSITMISGGVDTGRFSPVADRAAMRATLGVKPDEFLFLTVRRLDPRMGLLALIDAFARSASEFSHARLWIAGTGPQREALQARLDSLGLAGQARLLGFVADPDLPGLFNAADCTVMPSLALEGFGLATVESLACGTPVIGSRAGATPELLSALSDGLLFAPNDTDALSAKLRAVLTEPARLPGRDRCRDYVARTFAWDGPVAAFEKCHRELLGGGGGA